MRLLCPNCQKVVTVADDEAGKPVTCTACGKPFQAPSLFVPAVDQSSPTRLAPVPEPSLPPPLASESVPASRPAPAIETPSGFRAVSIKPDYLHWIVRVCSLLPLLLGFFAWVQSAPGGHSAYSQNGWQCFFGTLSVDPVAEETLGWAKAFREHLSMNFWLLPFGLANFLACLLAWGDFLFPHWKPSAGGPLQGLWERRRPIAAGLILFAFFCIAFQSLLGLGLQSAAHKASAVAQAENAPAPTTPEKKVKAELLIGKEFAAYSIEGTWSYALLKLDMLLLVAATGGLIILDRRGKKPAPQVGAVW